MNCMILSRKLREIKHIEFMFSALRGPGIHIRVIVSHFLYELFFGFYQFELGVGREQRNFSLLILVYSVINYLIAATIKL